MRILTFANQLTLLRILLIPFFAVAVVYGYPGVALATFVTAGVTDLLDGLIARATKQRTNLGAWLDPMADKLLLVTAFIVLTVPGTEVYNRIPLWLTILIISRDVAIVGVVAAVNLASGPRTFHPSVWGKLATATYLLTCSLFILFNYLGRASVVLDLAVWTALVVTLGSGADYARRLRQVISEDR